MVDLVRHQNGVTLEWPAGHDLIEQRGNHLERTFRAGTLLIGDRMNRCASPDGYVLIETGIGEEVRRVQVIPDRKTPRVRISSDRDDVCPAYEMPASKLRISGRVVTSIKRQF